MSNHYPTHHSFYLSVPKEFNYDQNLHFLKRSPKELLHTVTGDAVVKLLSVDGERVLVRISSGKDQLILTFLNTENPSPSIQKKVTEFVTEWFDLENDLSPFYEMAASDKLLKDLIERFYGYRIIGQPDLFESIIWAVLGQQINLSFAYSLKERFVSNFGEKEKWNGADYYLFPKPDVVAKLSGEQLLPLQFSRQKSAYTINIGEAFARGDISKEKLRGLSLQEAKELLMKIKGIGNWTANYALMKTFRYPDAFPLEDVALHKAIMLLKRMKQKPTLDQVKRVFKKYKGWEAYATLYLWKSLTLD